MKRFLRIAAVSVVLLTAALCIWSLVTPIAIDIPVTKNPSSSVPDEGYVYAAFPSSRSEAANIDSLAGLFGWTKPVPPPPEPYTPPVEVETEPEPEVDPVPEIEPEPEPEPEKAAWLVIIGEVKTEGKHALYYLKNTKTGQVVKAGWTPGASEQWLIIDSVETGLIVEHEGVRYIIQMR